MLLIRYINTKTNVHLTYTWLDFCGTQVFEYASGDDGVREGRCLECHASVRRWTVGEMERLFMLPPGYVGGVDGIAAPYGTKQKLMGNSIVVGMVVHVLNQMFIH